MNFEKNSTCLMNALSHFRKKVMSKRVKGLSFDEKKAKLSQAMMREGLFYNLKELEILGKKNGVIPQAVKEVVDCLIAERIITQEKIGSLNMYVFLTNVASVSVVSGPSRRIKTLILRPNFLFWRKVYEER